MDERAALITQERAGKWFLKKVKHPCFSVLGFSRTKTHKTQQFRSAGPDRYCVCVHVHVLVPLVQMKVLEKVRGCVDVYYCHASAASLVVRLMRHFEESDDGVGSRRSL